MIKKKLIFLELAFFLILIFIPLVCAENYGAGVYGSNCYGQNCLYCGDGICNNGETCSSCAVDCGACSITPSPGGGGSSGSSCTYNWQCTEWFPSICPESQIQERICANRGTCTGTEGMPNQTRTCEYLGHSEPLFDIYLTLEDKYKEICAGEKIKTNIKLENYAKVELLDAFMTYWIIDENNKLIAELKDTRAVEKETSFNIELKIPESTNEGTYRLYAQITYSGNKTAVTGESFEVLSKDNCVLFSAKYFNWNYLIYAWIIFIVLFAVFILIKIIRRKFRHKIIKTKGYKEKIKENLRKIKSRHYLLAIFGFIFLSFLFMDGNSMTGFVINNSNSIKNNFVIAVILLATLFGSSAFVYRKSILEFIKSKIKKHPYNSLSGLINKKVYTDSGDYIGKIRDIILLENKIDSLKIRLDKKHKVKGIIVSYRYVKSVKEIVIVENGILEKLTKE